MELAGGGDRERPRPWASWALLAATLGVQLATLGTADAAWRYGVVPAEPSLRALVAHPFVHSGWLHALGTLAFLALVGPWLEARLGRRLFLGIHLASALLGAALFVAAHPGGATPWLGGSAALAGLVGAQLAVAGRGRIELLGVAGGLAPALHVPGYTPPA
jgi:membrane associated rhomboid family serine protease